MSDRGSRPTRGLAAVACVLVTAIARPVAAQASEHHLDPPPAPIEHPPTLTVEVHGAGETPLERSTVCPSHGECVLGQGVGFGATVEWRGSDRVGIIGGYDFLLVDSASVFELGTLHAIRGGLRYVFDDLLIVHPFVEGAVGALMFGSMNEVHTGGALVTAGGGAEIELSESVAIVALLDLWLFSVAPFVTPDNVSRAQDFGVTVALRATVGVSILIGSAAAP